MHKTITKSQKIPIKLNKISRQHKTEAEMLCFSLFHYTLPLTSQYKHQPWLFLSESKTHFTSLHFCGSPGFFFQKDYGY